MEDFNPVLALLGLALLPALPLLAPAGLYAVYRALAALRDLLAAGPEAAKHHLAPPGA